MNKGFYFILILFTINSSLAQVFNIPGIPLIKNYTENDINYKLTVYDISQDSKGIMYFATPGGLLEYDGVRWYSYSAGEESDLRAVFYKDDQHIYTSGHGGFGYWSKNKLGKLEYTSLFFKEPTKQWPLLPVFSRITEINGNILFQTFQQIFIYNPIEGSLETVSAIKGFILLFASKGRAFIQDTGLGLFELKGHDRILIEGTEKHSLDITGVSVKNHGELIIATKEQGLWQWKNNVLSKTNWEVNELIEKHLISDIQDFENDQLIIGTVRNGLYIVSSEGKILKHLGKNNGILDNTVRRVFPDLNNNVWLSMEKGVSYIQVNSNINYLIDTDGEYGTVYTSYLKDSLLYLGTNQGLFLKNVFKLNSKPELIDNSNGQIWEIDEVDGEIFVGTHQGFYKVNNRKLSLIHLEGGAWIFKKHPNISDLMYVGFYSGIAVFKKVDGNWIFQEKWPGYGESSRFLEFDKYGQIWVAHPTKGYYRLRLSEDGMNLKEYEFYGVTNENIDTYAYICKIDDDLIFYNPRGFFNYDPIENSFIKSKYPSELFKDIKGINNIYQYKDIFWYSTQNSLGYIFRNGNKFTNISEPFYPIRNMHLDDFNKFEIINDTIFGIGIDDGVIFYNINTIEKQKNIDSPTIRFIQFISPTDTIQAPITQSELLKIPNRNNFVKIGIALPYLPISYSKKVQYKLIGLNEDWSDLDYLSELNFPGLSSGNYLLQIRAEGKDNINKISEFEFSINRPWYFNNTSVAIYAFLLILFNIYYRNYFKRKAREQLSYLKIEEERKRKRREEQYEKHKLETEREMLLLREENLGLEIKKKNSELASSTLNNIKKNELLIDLIKDIDKIDKEVLNSSLHSPIKKVIKKINNHLVDKDDWLTFELNFRNAHTDFFKKLREKHPDLSSNEIKLSAYLKLNLSSKEIASLMHISIHSVEQSRYRLRKKLNIPKDANLVNYIQTF